MVYAGINCLYRLAAKDMKIVIFRDMPDLIN